MKLASHYATSLLFSSLMVSACGVASAKTERGSSKTPASSGQIDPQDRADFDGDATPTPPDESEEQGQDREDEAQEASDELEASLADCYKGTKAICDIEKEIFVIVNQERIRAGLSPLSYSAKVAYVAREWSDDQAQRGRIGHDGWPSARESLYRTEFNARLNTSAENVAMTGFGDASSVARDLMRMWMGSPGHRMNILGQSASIGVGVAKDASGSWYATQLFTAR